MVQRQCPTCGEVLAISYRQASGQRLDELWTCESDAQIYRVIDDELIVEDR